MRPVISKDDVLITNPYKERNKGEDKDDVLMFLAY